MPSPSELFSLIDLLYDGALDATRWQAAITSICRAFGGEGAVLDLQDRLILDMSTLDFIEIDPSYRHTYAELSRLPDMNGAYRAVAESGSLGAITGDEIALDALRTLRPHLIRGAQVRQRLQHLECAEQEALAALDTVDQAVLLVDRDCSVIHANRAAAAILSGGEGITATRSMLGCIHLDDSAQLRRLVGAASERPTMFAGGTLAVRRHSGRRPLAVLVAPLRGERTMTFGTAATAIVLVTDPEATAPSPGAVLCTLYGLTPAEARIAEALLEHDRLADIAAKLNVSLATVRTLLQRAFDKTDTHRQAELVRLMLAHRMPYHSAPAGRA